MNKLPAILLVISLAVAGCSKPAPVELQQDGSDALLEASPIAQSDSGLGIASVDSGAVFPEDQVLFAGFIQIAHLVFDGGQNLVDTAFAHVLFENRAQPIRVGLRIIGYRGLDLGRVTINGNDMVRNVHRLGRPDSVAGVEYFRNMTPLYRPETDYSWRATIDTALGAFTTSILTTENLVVHSPRGGSVVRRDRNLPLSWTGAGNITLILSSYDTGTRKTKPLFRINVRNNRQYGVLGSNLLQLLPPGHVYVLTFVLANRKELETARFSGRVLVQATSVYNSYVEII